MKFVIDESVPIAIARSLAADGHDISSIAESTAGIDDSSVLSISLDERAVLITADKDFGKLVFLERRSAVGVLLIRLPGLSLDARITRVRETIASHGAQLTGAFAVLSSNRLRVRTDAV